MATPENRPINQVKLGDIFEISAIRARSNAYAFASKDNSNIGVTHLLAGVGAEIGAFLLKSDLKRKNIDPEQLRRDLALLRYFGDGDKPPSQREPRQSIYAYAVMEHSVRLAASRKNPMTQRPSARDLLVSIAVVASQKANSLRFKLNLDENRKRKDSLKIHNPEKPYLPPKKEINLIKIK